MADSADLASETPVDYDIEIDRLCYLSEEVTQRKRQLKTVWNFPVQSEADLRAYELKQMFQQKHSNRQHYQETEACCRIGSSSLI